MTMVHKHNAVVVMHHFYTIDALKTSLNQPNNSESLKPKSVIRKLGYSFLFLSQFGPKSFPSYVQIITKGMKTIYSSKKRVRILCKVS